MGKGRDTASPALEKGDPGHHWMERGSELRGRVRRLVQVSPKEVSVIGER